MSLTRWLRTLRSTLASSPAQRPRGGQPSRRAAQPRFELLEDRTVPAFLAPVAYDVGANPEAIVSGHFNQDSALDLAVANSAGGTVSVLLGAGDGTFQPAPDVAAGAGLRSLTAGDFNADGHLDLATADPTGVSVVLGNGDGSFRAPVGISFDGVGSSPETVAAGDFNGDGHLDLGVISNSVNPDYTSGFASVLAGDGRGNFAAPNTTAIDWGHHRSAAVADFDRDGIQDLATVIDSGLVIVLLGDPSGRLEEFTFFQAFYRPHSVAAADVNGDGHIDLVVADEYDGAYVALGSGLGTFDLTMSYPAGAAPTSVALQDFDRDGFPDIATANSASGSISVLRGRGDGFYFDAYLPAVHAAVGASPLALAAGDFNGDGWPDAATVNPASNSVSVLINSTSWPLVIRIGDASVVEGNTGTRTATFTVTLSAPSTEPVSVTYSTANDTATAGSDYNSVTGVLTFAPGETSKTVTVLVKGDRLGEANEIFIVNLSNATNATIADFNGAGTIVDDEPRISIGNVTKQEGRDRLTTLFTFTVTLSAAYDQAVTMSFRTVNGTATSGDYVAKTGTLTFAPGETTKTITVEVKGDSKNEATEYFYLDLYDGSTNSLFGKKRGTGTILNDD